MMAKVIGRVAMWLCIGVFAFAAPSLVIAQGICESFCAQCVSTEQNPCASLDGCSVSGNTCYYVSGDCQDCDPD